MKLTVVPVGDRARDVQAVGGPGHPTSGASDLPTTTASNIRRALAVVSGDTPAAWATSLTPPQRAEVGLHVRSPEQPHPRRQDRVFSAHGGRSGRFPGTSC